MKGKRVEEVFDNINAKLQALAITRLARDTVPEADKIEAVVYAMAEKFLDSVTTEQLKEAVGMTRLGQMMYQDGVEAGIAQGVTQGVAQGMETAKISIAKSLLGLPADEFIAEHVGLPLETMKELHDEN